jgi:ferric-dicitrate binding protein FerR (iron transport regulator)
MSQQDAKSLIKKYQSGLCSPEERAIVENWLTFGEATGLNLSDEELDADLAELRQRVIGTDRKTVRLWPRIAVAAVAAIVVGVYFFNASRHADTPPRTEFGAGSQDIAPGKNGATITLGNGKVIQLSDAKTGVVVGSDLKYSDGSSVGRHPEFISGSRTREATMLTATTAKGQTYQFTLPDGTKVWLNADSKLEFPSNFVNRVARFVKLSGEGYFEVSKDKSHPFIVSAKNQDVTVLGTHFNISAYQDERLTTTTLVEGSVKVSAFDAVAGRRTEILKPNQQSIQTPGGGMQVRNVDVSEALAWKEGVFIFNSTPLDQIMRQVSRWYNVDVIYTDESLKTETFKGSVSRYDKVSRILKTLEFTGAVKFKITDNKITVMK